LRSVVGWDCGALGSLFASPVSLDLFERLIGCLGNSGEDEPQCGRRKKREDEEDDRSHGGEGDGEGPGEDRVEQVLGEGDYSGADRSDRQRENLGYEEPEDRTHADAEGESVDEDGEDTDPSCVR